MSIKDKFLKYVSFDTQSDENSETSPSTMKQKLLGEELVREFKALNIANAYMDEFSYVYAKIAGNMPGNKCIGLIAHLDTAMEMSGADIKPQVISNYDGCDISLGNGTILSPKDFPNLLNAIGHELITTDGTTLLGADDKAGIAIIMELLTRLLGGDYCYPDLMICFTPDEEIGRGTDHFNYDYFKVDFAYTLDGSYVNMINYENFNAASAHLVFNGRSIHPGTAKGQMINSMLVAVDFQNCLPAFENPAYTEKYEGFNHPTSITGEVQQTKMTYIIRNHNKELFEKQKRTFRNTASFLNQKYGENTVELTIKDSYLNMNELVLAKPEVLDYPVKALNAHQLQPTFVPIRGGTDGARLSYGGIICPNLGTGSFNHHGALEYADIYEMNKMVEVLITMLSMIK